MCEVRRRRTRRSIRTAARWIDEIHRPKDTQAMPSHATSTALIAPGPAQPDVCASALLMCTDALEVRAVAGKGRGIFARRSLSCGSVIERCPVIDMPQEHWDHLDRTLLEVYCFKWGESLERPAVVLGYGSLYNHSFAPNAFYRRLLAQQAIDFIALRDITVGEEITVNYNGDPTDQTAVWFDSAE